MSTIFTDLARLIQQPEQSLAEKVQPELLAATSAWAVGLWKVEPQQLIQLVFACDPHFPSAVAAQFQQATLQVDRQETRLGIVNAVVNRQPIIAHATAVSGELAKSAGWLERFGARSSLSLPVENTAGEMIAVLAVAQLATITIDDVRYRELLQFAERLQKYL